MIMCGTDNTPQVFQLFMAFWKNTSGQIEHETQIQKINSDPMESQVLVDWIHVWPSKFLQVLNRFDLGAYWNLVVRKNESAYCTKSFRHVIPYLFWKTNTRKFNFESKTPDFFPDKNNKRKNEENKPRRTTQTRKRDKKKKKQKNMNKKQSNKIKPLEE